jgi:hypothetical protein
MGAHVNLKGWIPIRVVWKEGRPMIDWSLFGTKRFTDPFFDLTVERHLLHPFHSVFRRQTPIEVLGDWYAESRGVTPTGFIFHQSRSGSTLAGQMLAALEQNIVLSEPMPVDSILRASFRDPSISEEKRAEWLRWMVSALGQRRVGPEQHLYIKFDCWSLAELPVIRRAFPQTPWIFLYRNPVEILVSQIEQPASWTFPGVVHPAAFRLAAADMLELPHAEYCARVLARTGELALAYGRQEHGRLVNYEELPTAVWTTLPEYFGAHYSSADLERMWVAAGCNAKSPRLTFASDSQGKQERASEATWELARKWLLPVYNELEAMRSARAADLVHARSQRNM